ncbi:peptide deformylase [Candidatus Uhrbacteria bacterium]|jgi:peptide deformylase|nr:peptide deformylase [Candidatus Uhrbacteria bacterium]
MTRRLVLLDPNDELRKPSEDVLVDQIGTDELNTLIDDMKETMRLENGIGLAAPQINIHQRLIVIDTGGETGVQAFINPKILSKSIRSVETEEGCLSVPGVWGMVKRRRAVKVEALDPEGNTLTINAVGLMAIVFQHEIDHLNGILFIDKVTEYTKHPKM